LVFGLGLSHASAQSLDDWHSQHFTPSELADPLMGGLTADPDHDNVPNLLEFVSARDPRTAEPFATTTLGFIDGRLALTYRETYDLGEVQVWLQGSGDLRHWATYNTLLLEYERVYEDWFSSVTLLDPEPAGATRRFLRLVVHPSFPPPTAPDSTDATLTGTSTVLLEWSDSGVTESGFRIERLSSLNGEWTTVTTVPADTIRYTDTTASAFNGYTYRINALEGLLTLSSAPFGPPDRDHDGLPDVLELGTSYVGASGTFSTDPDQTDSDGDSMPDGWEIAHGYDPHNSSDATLDTDGDGFINRDECEAGSDPRDATSVPRDSDGDGMEDIYESRTPGLNPLDYYDNFIPVITIDRGAGQQGVAGMAPAEPLIISVKHSDGRRLANAPVTVFLLNGYITVEPTHADRLILDDTQPRTNLFGFVLFSGVLRERTQP
jgi:hypothetical protein